MLYSPLFQCQWLFCFYHFRFRFIVIASGLSLLFSSVVVISIFLSWRLILEGLFSQGLASFFFCSFLGMIVYSTRLLILSVLATVHVLADQSFQHP